MADRSSLGGFVRRAARIAGRKYEEVTSGEPLAEARQSYEAGKAAATRPDLPRDEEGKVRIVCRRYAEKRAVALDDRGRPACYEADHPDCEGCVADIDNGRIETW